uniref:Uncharacterized protein n=1 Tax=Oryza punctata TaxID=4537 RepID=A0A0E0K474_ORYPU
MARAQLMLVALVAASLLAALRSRWRRPVLAYCSGVRSLRSTPPLAPLPTPPHRLQNAAHGMRGLNAGNFASIPSKCDVNVPYTISASIDCSRYDWGNLVRAGGACRRSSALANDVANYIRFRAVCRCPTSCRYDAGLGEPCPGRRGLSPTLLGR